MIDVGALEDFALRELVLVDVAGIEVGILRWESDEVYAVQNRCPHMGGPLCYGHVGPRLEGVPGAVTADYSDPVVACPWHHWEFHVKTGRSLFDESYRIKTYPVTVEDGRIRINLKRRSAKVPSA
jgi:nitrite reductase/ring-hydroxylating ferredoxin subunit